MFTIKTRSVEVSLLVAVGHHETGVCGAPVIEVSWASVFFQPKRVDGSDSVAAEQ